jgi:hypothetical protein
MSGILYNVCPVDILRGTRYNDVWVWIIKARDSFYFNVFRKDITPLLVKIYFRVDCGHYPHDPVMVHRSSCHSVDILHHNIHDGFHSFPPFPDILQRSIFARETCGWPIIIQINKGQINQKILPNEITNPCSTIPPKQRRIAITQKTVVLAQRFRVNPFPITSHQCGY